MRILVAIAGVLLIGCASTRGLAPKAKPVEPNDLQSTATLAAARVDQGAWPAIDWWKRFGDPQLDRLEADALTGSPSLRLAKARVDRSRALAAQVRSALLPHADTDLDSTRQRFSENDIVPPPLAGTWQTESRAALDFSYEFDFWGRNRAALAAAVSEVKTAEVDARAARLVLSVAVARAYVRLQHLYDRLDVAGATLKDRRRLYDLTRKMVSAGIATRVELKQAEAALPATREEIAALDESVALTRDELASLLGRGPDAGLDIARPDLRSGRDAILPARLPAVLIGRRPDVVARRWRVEAAQNGIRVAKAAFYPNVDLLAFAGLQSIGLDEFLHAGSRVAGIGPAVTLPVFEGGRLRGGLAAADADYDGAVERYNQTLVDALRDVADRLASARSVQEQTERQNEAIAAVREAYSLAVLRYREGVGNYLSVLSAEAQLLAQERLAADLRARSLDVEIGLVRALGGGLNVNGV